MVCQTAASSECANEQYFLPEACVALQKLQDSLQAVTDKLAELSKMHIPKLESEAGEFKHDADCKELTLCPCKPESAATTPNAAAVATAEDLMSAWIAAAVKGEKN